MEKNQATRRLIKERAALMERTVAPLLKNTNLWNDLSVQRESRSGF